MHYCSAFLWQNLLWGRGKRGKGEEGRKRGGRGSGVIDETMLRCNLPTNVFNTAQCRGAKVDAIDEDKCTPLHYAAKSGRTEAVKLLLEAGAKTDMETDDNDTPIHLAAGNGHLL